MAYDEFAHCTPQTKSGILAMRALPDETVLAIARDNGSPEFAEFLAQIGSDTNRSWITARAADTAYDRGLIDEVTYDLLIAD
jgi:hypothetical protein